MKVLVVHGSKRGGTAGLAEMVGQAFVDLGFTADVADAADPWDDPVDPDLVVIGGALYAGRWHKDARRFARRHHDRLLTVPVWLFSSGPLDDSAETSDIAATSQVAHVAERLGARGHATFGGRLEPDVHGFPASALARTHAGDFRDQAHVRAWVAGIVADLAAGSAVG